MGRTGFLENLENKLNVSRRQFVKGMTATCAAATVLGCSSSSSDDVYIPDINTDPDKEPPIIAETAYEGASPHNCGGGCLLKAYVANGVIKRFTTDERPEKSYLDTIAGDYLQERVCPRCRGQKGWIYGSNRLTYPLIQTGERGNLATFKRVTWEQAAAYFKYKLVKVRDKFGPGAFHNPYSSGIGGGYDPTSILKRLTGSGAWLSYRDDYSFPEWEHTHRIMHDEESQPKSNDQQDAFNSDELVIWCYNLAEMFNQQQITWMTKQIQEKNVHVTVIDQHYSRTAVLAADEFIAPVHATDTAMMMAMIHCAMTDYKDELFALYNKYSAYATRDGHTVTTMDDLRKAVGQYIYGFFDTNSADGASVNESYTLNATDNLTFTTKSAVPQGASLAAYVFGNVTAPGNATGSKSIYPDNIGYNTRAYAIDGAADPLGGKTTKAYGQVEKTPEWAEKICGVPAAKIRELTKMFLTKNVTCWTMGGQQRNSEGEQVCWMYTVLMTFFLCFGKQGRTFGRPYGKGNDAKKNIAQAWNPNIPGTDATLVPDAVKDGVGSGVVDPATGETIAPYLVESAPGNGNYIWKTTLVPYGSSATFPGKFAQKNVRTIPVFLWLDAVEATNKPKINVNGNMVWPSRWNDPQIQNLPAPVKFLWHVAGNININQNGNTNLATKILTNKSASCVSNTEIPGTGGIKDNPLGYTLECIALCDVVMTSSARWADLVLPGTMGFERYTFAHSGRSPMTFFSKKVVEPQGDAVAEIEMGARLMAAFGKRDAYTNGYDGKYGLTFEENVFRAAANLPANMTNFGGRDFDAWVKNGMYKYTDDLTKVENYICYGAFLTNPGKSAAPTAKPGQSVNATKTAMWTLSGRVEAYSFLMMEDYEMRGYNNVDNSISLVNGGSIETAFVTGANASKGRFVYPIPMYIPIVEGRHHDDAAAPHPDPLGLKTEYPLSFHTWHMIYRSHSTFNSSPLTNEVKYYKRDSQGNPAHLKRSVTNANAGATAKVPSTDTASQQVWMDDVYETVWLNPTTPGLPSDIAEGVPVILESPRGRIKVSPHFSQRIRPGVVMIGQGSWYNPDNNGAGGAVDKNTVDIGGNANTLFDLRPSRIGQGMTLASDCRVKIYKA